MNTDDFRWYICSEFKVWKLELLTDMKFKLILVICYEMIVLIFVIMDYYL